MGKDRIQHSLCSQNWCLRIPKMPHQWQRQPQAEDLIADRGFNVFRKRRWLVMDREWSKLKNLPTWQESTERNKNRRNRGRLNKQHSWFCNAHGLVPPQKFRIGQEIQKHTGRVVSRGGAVQDGSEPYSFKVPLHRTWQQPKDEM